MPTLIRIDRSTIRRNPDAGRTEWARPSLCWFEVTVTTPAMMVKYRSTGEMRHSISDTGILAISGRFVPIEHRAEFRPDTKASDVIAINGEQEMEFSSATPGVMIKAHQEVAEYRTRPVPAWLYEYELTPVTCIDCGATFFHDKLEDDETDDEIIRDVCPKCGRAECCDVAYEKIEDVVREMGLNT